MGRGLDGLISRSAEKLCSFEGPRRSRSLSVAIARGKHLFPFRTEQLSLLAPMVLGSQGPGRVGRRRFLDHTSRPAGRLVVVLPHQALGPPRRGAARER